MKRRELRVAVVVVLSALLATACAAPATQPTKPAKAAGMTVSTLPGTGDSVADEVYEGAKVRIGEPAGAVPEPTGSVQYKSSPPPGNYLLERVVRVASGTPGTPTWDQTRDLVYSRTRTTQHVYTFTFRDGSVLRLVASDVGRLGQRSKLQAAGVSRAGGPGTGRTVADRVYHAAGPQVGEWVGWAEQFWPTVMTGGYGYAYPRVRQAVGALPSESPPASSVTVGDRGRQRFVRCDFHDGSALLLVGTPTHPDDSSQEWMLDAVEVVRPTGAAAAETGLEGYDAAVPASERSY